MDEPGRLKPEDAEIVEAHADAVIQYIGAVFDPALRTSFVGEKLLALPDAMLVLVIARIHHRAQSGEPPALETWSALTDPETLAERLDDFRRSRIYHLASKAGADPVVALFSKGRGSRTARNTDEGFLMYGLTDLTLGHRITAARTTDHSTRMQARYDNNPEVIRNLLLNPRTTESDVLRIASQRPVSPTILETVYRSRKWIARYRVKVALAMNPYMPENMVINLLPHLLRKDLADVSEDNTLSDAVRLAAIDQLNLKDRNRS